MTIPRLVLREILFRKTNFALSLLAVTIAATLFVAAPVLIDGYGEQLKTRVARLDDETRKLMKNMGFNLMIVHRDTNMADFWSDFEMVDMPQDYVGKLAGAKELTLVTHLVATLQAKIKWNGRSVLLVGYLPESTQAHKQKKAPMGYVIEPGQAFLGHELHGDLKEGDRIEVLGKEFTVARRLGEQGSREDITISVSLKDAQEMLDRAGKVNQILALGCRCAGERLPKIRKQLEVVLPETKITEFRSMALARAEQRDLVKEEGEAMVEEVTTYASVSVPMIVLACVVWLAMLGLANVRERRMEIGILRAIGVGTSRVAVLFLGKSAILGLIGGGLGIALGTVLAQQLGTRAFDVSSELLAPAPVTIALTLIGAPLISAIAGYVPTLAAVLQDPAVVLRDD